jgi:Luciferase-like monooxygenase
MEIGAAIFFTNYSMASTDLAVALEQRGFDSLWVAEHSHMPVTRRFTHPLGEAVLTKEYFDVMDPFVTLSAAAAVTKGLKLGTAICLVIQRDTIQTAKLVASLDQVSTGRRQESGMISVDTSSIEFTLVWNVRLPGHSFRRPAGVLFILNLQQTPDRPPTP